MEVVAGLLLRRLADRPDECALVRQILGELRSLAGTVTASLEFVTPVELERAPLDPVELLDSAIAQAQARVAFAGAIERDFAPGLPALHADGDQLRSVLTNLVVNAFEAMAEAGGEQRLEVSLRCLVRDCDDGKVLVDPHGRTANVHTSGTREIELTLHDSGPGIPAPLREKVFYPFFTTKESGSGIGLAAAQKIVTNHGGIIEIPADGAPGATFRLRLPIVDDGLEGSSARQLPWAAS
jgi:signal transduction histidine kinase